MKFRSGKYAGKDIEYVQRVAPWYIEWVKKNRPEMLKGNDVKTESKNQIPSAYQDSVWLRSLKPNLDFNNQTTELPKRKSDINQISKKYW